MYEKDDTYLIDINGDVYEIYGEGLGESVYTAIEEHIEKNLDFSEYLIVTVKNDSKFFRKMYLPGLLCGFGYLSLQALYKLILKSAFTEEDTKTEGV